MSVLRRLTWLAFPLLSMAFNVQANTAPAQLNKAELEQRFAKLGLQVEEIKTSDINGLLEVQTSGGVLFSSPDGEHFIAGTLYALDGNGGYVDVLAKRQAPLNAKKIAALQDSMIEFKAPNEKYAITVFTDITCGYCVRLHSQIKSTMISALRCVISPTRVRGRKVKSRIKWRPSGVLTIRKRRCTMRK